MIDAKKREKVIRGLKACNRQSYNGSDCQNCPYYEDEYEADMPYGMCNIQDMFDDALTLLKEQEPRVMTLEELRIDADESVVCWVEFASKSAVNVTAPYRGMAHICLPFLGTETITFVVERNYGEKWRCWTARPTPEQMQDTPWEGDVDEA